MAFEQGLCNSKSISKDKFILQRDQLFNLTRTLTNFRGFFDIPALHTNALSKLCCY